MADTRPPRGSGVRRDRGRDASQKGINELRKGGQRVEVAAAQDEDEDTPAATGAKTGRRRNAKGESRGKADPKAKAAGKGD